jgi:hypothetical protein
MQNTWLFQSNPDRFDIGAYLATNPIAINWLITRYQHEIYVGDRVFIWRAGGKGGAEDAGVIAEGLIVETPRLCLNEEDAAPFWADSSEQQQEKVRALIRLLKVANKKEILKRDWLKDDPVLHDLEILRMANATNYKLSLTHSARFDALWAKTGQDFTWAESLAGLWVYSKTKGESVSRVPGSPVANVAIRLGRAVTGIYNKVMNFRALDPTDPRKGLLGTSETDRAVWAKFFDIQNQKIRRYELNIEFERFWGDGGNTPPDEGNALDESVTRQAQRLTQLGLAELMKRYRLGAKTPGMPRSKGINARYFQRDPLVIAIAKQRANFRCEVEGCANTLFYDEHGDRYCEVHHIERLADGGKDIIENAACLCPGHHREVHHGKERAKITAGLRVIREKEFAVHGGESKT